VETGEEPAVSLTLKGLDPLSEAERFVAAWGG
jgi:hypothetical protein